MNHSRYFEYGEVLVMMIQRYWIARGHCEQIGNVETAADTQQSRTNFY